MSKIDLKAENRNKYYQRYFSMFNSFLLLFKLFFFILLLPLPPAFCAGPPDKLAEAFYINGNQNRFSGLRKYYPEPRDVFSIISNKSFAINL
jgi:hypothetical protein